LKGEATVAQVRDVVCGMTVDSDTAEHKSEYKGQTYYFCAPGCKRSFDRDPEKYLHADNTGEGKHH
jgi:YHS domain-containing protein